MSKNYYIIPLFIPHEGCPHNCVFCNQDRITGEKDRVTSETAVKTIEEYLSTIDHTTSTIEVSFFGGTFTAVNEDYQKELLKVAKLYKDKGLIDKIRLSTRPDYIDDHILGYLKEYGVDIIEMGVQSLNDEVLKLSGRGHTYEDVLKASKLIKDKGFTLGHQLMIGLPGDTYERDVESVKASVQMKPDIARIYPALVIKDTPMEAMYRRGTYIPYTLEEAVEASRTVLEEYNSNNVQVIRIGLQPTDNIAEGRDVVAGPFHPAFRELVEGSLLKSKIEAAIKNSNPGKSIELILNPKSISKLYADKKRYFNELKKELMSGIDIKVIQRENIDRDTVLIKTDAEVTTISI